VNIFILDKDPKQCAEWHVDKHVVKMIIEYAQLMSTAHRMLDGEQYGDKTANGRNIKRWKLADRRENILYKASHINHPDAQWARQTSGNYMYLWKLFSALCDEYTYRYGKVHETDRKLRGVLICPPLNIKEGEMIEPPQCMPDYCKHSDVITAYKNYYIQEKKSFANWKKRNIPSWFTQGLEKELAII
jgi:hypothetical protein